MSYRLCDRLIRQLVNHPEPLEFASLFLPGRTILIEHAF